MYPLFVRNCNYKNSNKVGESIGHTEGYLKILFPHCLQMFGGSQLLYSYSDFGEDAISYAALLTIVIVRLSLSSREQPTLFLFASLK